MKYGEKVDVWAGGIPDLDGVAPAEVPVIECYPAQGDSKKRGSVAVFPGGGYRHRAGHEGITIANWLNYQGINAYVVNYRVYPHRHPVPLADAQRAIRVIRKIQQDEGQENRKLGAIGFSAGGHLAACVLTMDKREVYPPRDELDSTSCKVDAGILCYPVATFSEHMHSGSCESLLGEKKDSPLRQEMSPDLAITADTPPCFIWHTAADGSVKVQNSLMFAQKLADNGVPFELHVYPAGHHGLGTINTEYHDVCYEWTKSCHKWLRDQGF